jgi:hypothetical protein
MEEAVLAPLREAAPYDRVRILAAIVKECSPIELQFISTLARSTTDENKTEAGEGSDTGRPGLKERSPSQSSFFLMCIRACVVCVCGRGWLPTPLFRDRCALQVNGR